MSQGLDPELGAMQSLLTALEPLDDEARARVLAWVAGRYEISLTPPKGIPHGGSSAGEQEAAVADIEPPPSLAAFGTLAELFAAATPKTNGEKALVAGYWLQTREGAAELAAQAINTQLKHLGHGVANITIALEELKLSKPALAIQLRKGGTSQQARKKYKITDAGVKYLEKMVHSGAVE